MKIKILFSACLLFFYAGLMAQQTLTIPDTRSVDHPPSDFKRLLQVDFKRGSHLGITEGHTFKTVISLSGWSDPSGGYANQLGFDQHNMYMRSAPAGSADWSGSGGWRKLVIYNTNDVLNTPGNVIVNGNIGIGTSNPSADLQVSGIASIGLPYGQANLTVRSTDASNGFIIKGNSDRQLAVFDDFDNTQLVVRNSGNVGIGTSSPSAKLDVAGTSKFTGKMTVDNDIIAKKLRVTVDPNAVPDYVFKADYDLKTLAEVEAYINAHSHLPNIPGASQIGAEGQDVGKMQLRLLEKIEELTLYTIAQEKKLKASESRNKQLESALADLLNRVENLEKNK